MPPLHRCHHPSQHRHRLLSLQSLPSLSRSVHRRRRQPPHLPIHLRQQRTRRLRSSGRSDYNQNLYLQSGGSPAIVWGNIIRGAGGYGAQLRSGGVLAYNYFAHNVYAASLQTGGSITHNIVEYADNLNTAPRGIGFELVTTYGSAISQTAEFNFIVNTHGGFPKAIATNQSGTDYVQSTVIRNNTIFQGGWLDQVVNNAALPMKVTATGNLVDSPYDQAGVTWQPDPPRYDWINSDNNAFYSTRLAWSFKSRAGYSSFDAWKATSGEEAHSLFIAPIVTNPTADIASYSKSIGGPSTEAATIQAFRNRKAGTWSDEIILSIFTTISLNNTNPPTSPPLDPDPTTSMAPPTTASRPTQAPPAPHHRPNPDSRLRHRNPALRRHHQNQPKPRLRCRQRRRRRYASSSIATASSSASPLPADRSLDSSIPPISSGTYQYSARQIDPFGNVSQSPNTAIARRSKITPRSSPSRSPRLQRPGHQQLRQHHLRHRPLVRSLRHGAQRHHRAPPPRRRQHRQLLSRQSHPRLGQYPRQRTTRP